jgi:hypothetical protein
MFKELEGAGRTLATIANFEANLVDAKDGYPYGYSMILPIRFTSP